MYTLSRFSTSSYLRLGRFAAMVLLSAAPWSFSYAQDQDQSQDPVNMRLDRLEQGLNDVQRQLNAGAVPAGTETGTPPAPSTGTQALNTEVRLDSLESQMRDLNGEIEEVQHGVDQLNSRLDKMQADNELRFHALEHPGEGPGPSVSTGPAAGSPPQTAPTDDSSAPGGPASLSPGNGFLSPPDGSKPPQSADQTSQSGDPAAPDQPASAGPVQLPSGSPESQYNYAFNLIRHQDYANAESAFKQFLQQNPHDQLAGNAQYWLGETFLVRQQYQQAAAIFAQGVVTYKKSEKTPNMLLSLGISLNGLHKKHDACLIFAKLERQFPSMPQSIRDMERAQKRQTGCTAAQD